MSEAESAMKKQEYKRALANVDSALAKDSANVKAHMMRARILRQMADSSVSPERYAELYKRARQAEEKAIKFDPGRRSEVQSQRKLAYIQEYRKGAQRFQRARRSGKMKDYLRAAAFFKAAGAIRPDSTGPILNEAYARLNAAQQAEGKKQAQMQKKVVPILERYIKKEEAPNKNAYIILTQLYLQNNNPEKVISFAKKAIDDLSDRPTHFQISGTRGLKYTGTVEVGGSSRSVSGTIPDRIKLSTSSGRVAGSFQKSKAKGQLRVSLFLQGSQIASDQATAKSDTASISENLTGLDPLAQLQNYRLNALNQAGKTEQAKEIYRKRIEKNPKNATYRYNYGSLLLNEDKYESAAEQLAKAVELDPDDPKKQYNLGAAYLNKGVELQDSLVTMRDSLVNQNRKLTEEEKKKLKALDQARLKMFRKSIPPLERAKQLSGKGGQYRKDACQALVQAYVQTQQTEKAQKVEKCAGQMGSEGTKNESGGSGG
ncbi:MAG: tetratricopeptide repeat protein [Salinibacter sp.]|uniref:tetratricopeptide repeat protein n=1 Tax=Salinibacter sp. TaxID=2065818 RepID=UPI0035D43658